MTPLFLRSVFIAFMCFFAASVSHAADAVVQTVKIEKATTMQATASMSALGGYMVVYNMADTAERLLGARASGFDTVEIHASIEENGIAKMRPVKDVEIAPKGSVTLAPQGLHVMLMGNKAARDVGQSIPLTLVFEKSGPVSVNLEVVSPETLAERFPSELNKPESGPTMDHSHMGHH